MADCVVLQFRHLKVVDRHLGVPHRHVGDGHAATISREQDIADPQVDGVDPTAGDGGIGHIDGAVLGDGPLVEFLPRYYPERVATR